MVTAQIPLPAQAPLQPVKVESLAGLAVRVTTVLAAYTSLQSAPQPMPLGLLVTVPEPAPLRLPASGLPATTVTVAVSV
jgi:hypothetical protein